MLSAARKSGLAAVRLGARASSTIVQESTVPDFQVQNEPVYGYLPGSAERTALEAREGVVEDVPIMIGDQEYRTDEVKHQVMPHNHKQPVAQFYWATSELVQKAIDVGMAGREKWERVPME